MVDASAEIGVTTAQSSGDEQGLVQLPQARIAGGQGVPTRQQVVVEDLVVRAEVALGVCASQGGVAISGVGRLQQGGDEGVVVPLLGLHQQVATRLQVVVQFLRPETGAG